MIAAPTPVVIVSGHVDVGDNMEVAMQALKAGAFAVLPKPVGPTDPNFGEQQKRLLDTVKQMAGVKLVRHWRDKTGRREIPVIPSPPPGVAREVVAIAISTGGPAALQQLLTSLPRDFPAPILVVQHIAEGFVEGLILWLDSVSSLRVKLAEDGEKLRDSTVYLAADGVHLGVSRRRRVSLSATPVVNGFRPSGTVLFESVAAAFGKAAVCVIMTGMGDDGVAGLAAVRKAGGRIIAQDEKTSVVFGMPAAAIETGFVDVVLPLAAIVNQLGTQVYDE